MSLILKQELSGTVPTPPAGKGTVFLNDSNQLGIKTSSGTVATVPAVTTSNTQIFYNNTGTLAGSNAFVFNNTSNTVTVENLTVSNTLIAGDIAVSSIANGTSNVDIVGVSGNVTVSVSGNANIITATGTGVIIAGTLNSTGNANLANLITAEANITGNLLAAAANITGNLLTVEANITGNLNIGANLNLVGMVTSDLIPNADVTYDLGNSTNRWNNLFLAGNTIYLGNTSLSSGTGDALEVSDMDVSGNILAGNIYANSGTISANSLIGTLATNAQPNLTSIGTLTSLDVTGNTLAGNVYANSGTIGANLLTGTLTTNAQPNVTSVGTLTSLSVTGNTISGNVYANSGTIGASLLTGTLTTAAQPNITSVGTLTSLSVTGNITTGNISGANLISANFITGTLTTASQPNITSVGILSSLSATGNISGGNLSTTGALSVTGNANVGNIGATTGVFTANISANNLSTTNKVTAGNGLQVTTGALQILAGNLDVTGNINVTGNLNYSNVTDLVVGDPLIYIGANNTGDLYDLGIVASYNDGVYEHTGLARNASDDVWTFFDGVVAEPTTVIDWANATYPTVKLGNLIATGTANITGNANVGNIGGTNAVFTGTANITGNVTAGNVYANSGTIGASLLTGTLTTAAQPNVTSLGSLTGLTVSNATGIVNFTTTANVTLGAVANLHISGGTTGQLLSTDGAGNLSFTTVSTTIGITDDTTTNATYYPTLTTATTGSIGAANVSSTKLYFNPSTGALAATDFNSLSDITFKENIEPIVNGMVTIANIEPVSFNWVESGRKAYGVIAQEIEKVLPEIVTTGPDGKKTVSYDQIIPFLISAIKELSAEIQELKKRQ